MTSEPQDERPASMESPEMDSLGVQDLLKRSLSTHDEDDSWKYVRALHRRGSREVLEAASELAASDDPRERTLAADILAQLGSPGSAHRQARLARVLALLQEERDPTVLQAAAIALGHIAEPSALGPLLRLTDHPEPDVREAVAFSLPSVVDETPSQESIDALIALSRDENREVRDWATFALGTQLKVDSDEVRDALAERMSDEDSEVKEEAMLGLARRRDPRVFEALIAELSSDVVSSASVEAAAELGDPRLRVALLKLKDWWNVDPELLDKAIAASG